MSSIEETRTREITSVRGMYDKELSHARRALDETAKDKAKFEIEAERHKTNAQELKGKLSEKTAEAERAERASVAFENQLAEAKKKNDDIAAEKNRYNLLSDIILKFDKSIFLSSDWQRS